MSLIQFVPIIGDILDRILPDKAMSEEAKLKLAQLAADKESAQLNAELQQVLGQLEINKVEAASPNLFVAGWRPAIGWTCAISLFCYYVPYCLVALFIWAHQCLIQEALVPRPDLGIADLIGLVMSMLGIASMRTFERVKNTVPDSHELPETVVKKGK